MKTGKHLVELLSDLTGHEPDWVVFPKDKTGDAFSTAFFGDVRSETIAALMPMELADKDSQNFTIDVSEFQIAITVFCRYEDAPTNARPAYRRLGLGALGRDKKGDEVMSKHGCCADKACTLATCMDLPKGTTCGDCFHVHCCCAIYGHKPADTYCDWFPRRFIRASNIDAVGGEVGK